MWDEITYTNGYVWSPNIYYACENLSMLGLKLIQVSKNAPPTPRNANVCLLHVTYIYIWYRYQTYVWLCIILDALPISIIHLKIAENQRPAMIVRCLETK